MILLRRSLCCIRIIRIRSIQAQQSSLTIPSVIASEAKQSQIVTLKVYDILGNEVATLVNEEKQAGVYEVEFDASVNYQVEFISTN